MSTEREQVERELAEELGFRVVNPKVAGIGHVPEFVEGDGESDTDYIADGRHWALFEALLAARLKLASVEREREGGGRLCVCGHDKGYHDSITELGHSRGIFCGVFECREICTGWRPEERRKSDRRAESASLKLAAADRLAAQASNFAARVQERCPSWFDEGAHDTDFAEANAALRSALLEYSKTKV